MLRTFAFLLLASFGSVDAAFAFTEEVNNAVEGHPDTTFFDLVRQIVPDLAHDEQNSAVGKTVIPLRHIREGFGGRPPTLVDVRTVEAIRFRGEGSDGTLMFLHLGRSEDRPESIDALVYFDDKLRLVDAVEVGMGEYAGYTGEPLRISKQNDAIVLWSIDSGGGSSLEQFSVVFLRNGRFELMDTLPVRGSWDCGWARMQEIAFKPVPEAADGFWPIEVSVTDTMGHNLTVTCEGTLPTPHEKMAKTTYRWDAAREAYAPESDALLRFAEETAK